MVRKERKKSVQKRKRRPSDSLIVHSAQDRGRKKRLAQPNRLCGSATNREEVLGRGLLGKRKSLMLDRRGRGEEENDLGRHRNERAANNFFLKQRDYSTSVARREQRTWTYGKDLARKNKARSLTENRICTFSRA